MLCWNGYQETGNSARHNSNHSPQKLLLKCTEKNTLQNLYECLEANDENSVSATQIKSVTPIAIYLTEEIDNMRKPMEEISNNQLIKCNQNCSENVSW